MVQSKLSQALAHMTQLINQGCSYEQAVTDTRVAYELDDLSSDMLEACYDYEQQTASPAAEVYFINRLN